jgi:predicted component of type VI protein secretion system
MEPAAGFGPSRPSRPGARPATPPTTRAGALMRGLGLPNLNCSAGAEEIAEIVGAMLREATAGTIDVLMARALTKRKAGSR